MVEEMLKNTSGLESVMKSQDNRNAEDELSEKRGRGRARWNPGGGNPNRSTASENP